MPLHDNDNGNIVEQWICIQLCVFALLVAALMVQVSADGVDLVVVLFLASLLGLWFPDGGFRSPNSAEGHESRNSFSFISKAKRHVVLMCYQFSPSGMRVTSVKS